MGAWLRAWGSMAEHGGAWVSWVSWVAHPNADAHQVAVHKLLIGPRDRVVQRVNEVLRHARRVMAQREVAQVWSQERHDEARVVGGVQRGRRVTVCISGWQR